MSNGCGVFDAAHQEEVLRVPLFLFERRVRFQQQRVSGLQNDVAQLGVNPFAASSDRQDRRVVS